MPENAKPTPVASAPARTPAQTTGKGSLLVMIVLYALWLVGLAYVAWINVQAGNQ